MLKEAMKRSGLKFPRRQGGFHIFCHTYGSKSGNKVFRPHGTRD